MAYNNVELERSEGSKTNTNIQNIADIQHFNYTIMLKVLY